MGAQSVADKRERKLVVRLTTIAASCGNGMSSGLDYVLRWGGYVGEGVSLADYCTVGAVAKRNHSDMPYVVANEAICSSLGAMAGIPVVPGAILKNKTELAYLSLKFGADGELPPAVIPEEAVKHCGEAAAAVIVFDLWIANDDRHDANLAFQKETKGRSVLLAFDHDRALLGTQGERRLKQLADTAVAEGCLSEYVTDAVALGAWVTEIGRLQAHHFRHAIAVPLSLGLVSESEAQAITDFLLHRRNNLKQLLKKAIDSDCFPGIKQGVL